MSPEPCCAKKQAKLLEDQHIFELLGGVNPEYELIRTQVTSQDPLPPIGTVFALLQGEESRRLVMTSKPDITPERSALANNNVNNALSNRG